MKKRLIFLLSTGLFLFVGASGQIKEASTSQEKDIERLIQALGTEGWEKAVEALVALGEPAVSPLVRRMISTEDPRYAPYRAALTLGKIGSPRAEQALLEALEDENLEEYVLRGILRGLGDIGSVRAEEALIKTLKNKNLTPSLRGPAADALTNFPSEKVVRLLADVLEEEGQRLGYYISPALSRIGTDQALDALLVILENDPQYLIREDVHGPLLKSRPEKTQAIFLKSLEHEDWWNWKSAADKLAEIGGPVQDNLIPKLEATSPAVRWKAAWVLGRIASETSAEALKKASHDDDWLVRNEAAVALLRIYGKLPEYKVRKAGPPEGSKHVPSSQKQVTYDSRTYVLYPQTLDKRPEIPSPCTASEGTEVVVVLTKDQKYALVPVTVENGAPYVYAKGGKGQQLEVDADDFPTLAETGLHSEAELNRTLSITGRSVAEVTVLGRPGCASGEGFMSEDEDIISILRGDNRLVRKMGLTHPRLAKALFQFWNLILQQTQTANEKVRSWDYIKYLLYNGKKISIEATRTKGWQESIFDDEIYGGYQIHIRRDLEVQEKAFLETRYSDLSANQKTDMIEKLTHVRMGEMLPYYIMRYGFYEGHTGYRADPIAIALIFGLKSPGEIEAAFPGELHKVLAKHFMKE